MKNIVIIGKAIKGATGEMKLIRSDMDITRIYGRGTLVDGYRMVRDNISDDVNIFAVKACGIHGRATLNTMDSSLIVHHKSIAISTTQSLDDENVSISIDDEKLVIYSSTVELTYMYDEFKTIGELIDNINIDASEGLCPVTFTDNVYGANAHPSFSIGTCNRGTVNLTKSSSGNDDNKNMLYHSIYDILSRLIGKNIDVIVPIDCLIDNSAIDALREDDKGYALLDVYTQDDVKVFHIDDSTDNIKSGDDVYVSETIAPPRITREIFPVVSEDLIKEYYPGGKEKNLSFYKLFCDFARAQSYSGVITKAVLGFKSGIRSENYYKVCFEHINSVIDEKHNNHKALVSCVIGDVLYDNGTILDSPYIAYASRYVSCSGYENIEGSRCLEGIKACSIIQPMLLKKIRDYNFITLKKDITSGDVYFLNTRNNAQGMLSYEYIISSLATFYKEMVPMLRDSLGEALTDSNMDLFDARVSECLSSYVLKSMCYKFLYSIETTSNGDTYIRCDLFFPGFISPFEVVAELGGEAVE